jgi:hypothetical protein
MADRSRVSDVDGQRGIDSHRRIAEMEGARRSRRQEAATDDNGGAAEARGVARSKWTRLSSIATAKMPVKSVVVGSLRSVEAEFPAMSPPRLFVTF